MRVIDLSQDHGARTARHAAAACCQEAAAGPVCVDAIELMTSEVVTNALRHGGGRVSFGLACGPCVVRVEVADEERAVPVVTDGSFEQEGGRGMLIVDALATDWGVQRTTTGKTVWFEVTTQP